MFRLSQTPIFESPQPPDPAAGGFVTFVGRVRNRHRDREVVGLDYEAYEPLAVAEGRRILEEATTRFGLIHAQCVHRVGSLAVGDLAILVDVASGHREQAFAACRYIVDEVKRRVPIWKHERFADGSAEWVNALDASPPHVYYDRQMALPEVGAEGQRRLAEARVLVVGAGGLGCPALLYLASAGVGKIGICDDDALDESNLHRQPLYAAGQVGQPKTILAAERLRLLNPHIEIAEHPRRLKRETAGICTEYDVLLDCTDNFSAKFLLNKIAMEQGKTLISASIYRMEGQLQIVVPGGPCLRCLWPDKPEDGCVGTCEEVGVLGFVPGVFGVLQAAEAIKLILGIPSPLSDGKLMLFDLQSMSSSTLELARDPSCPVCGSGCDLEESLLMEADELEGCLLVDVRDGENDLEALLVSEPSRPIVLMCSRGIRSLSLVQELRSRGIRNVYSLAGGAQALERGTIAVDSGQQ